MALDGSSGATPGAASIAERRWQRDGPLLAVGGAAVALHLTFAGRYGFFRDELYFIACGARPAWGYVDQPPLLPWLAFAWDWVVGGSLWGFRVAPALVAGVLAFVTGRLARRLGGGGSAALLAAVSVTLAPVFAVSTHLLTVNTLEAPLWTGLVLLVQRVLGAGDSRQSRRRDWLAIGVCVGVGLSNKYSMAFWALALLAGIGLTARGRRVLASWNVALAALVALLMVLPGLLWQAARGWPFLELLRAGAAGKNAPFEVVGFVRELVLQVHPFTLPLWLGGLWLLWRRERALALAALAFLAAMFVLHAKPYYAAPAFPTLFAAGAVSAERWLVAPWRRAAAFALLLAGGALTAPLAVPLLPVDTLIRYERWLGIRPTPLENKVYDELPQHLADQFGWREIALAAREAWERLAPDERAHAAVFSLNYGNAAAIARFGGLPSISGHNQFGEWGPGGADGSVLIVLGARREWIEPYYASIERIGTGPSSAYMMPYERAQPIWLVREPKLPLAEAWARLRHID